ncbi:tetratricopeptide repeat protein [Metabacillus idriensis]|uniref:tetratricopeptide repeat protein n=1 Tax=Metabacillus idriensis TaxID=324768 RepID=UPI002812FA07|nr:tetratricopeptide repeat protein [Metabacillus idriensis]MDR0138160.1 tetratricopeptide repeat protein [Metabacillus idriensis]
MMDGKKQRKVIPFPNLSERLVDKGLEALKNKQFKEALSLFYEVLELGEERAEIHLGIALCLMELGELEEAKAVCRKMLHEDIGDYFTVMQVYLTVLIQLRQYSEVQQTIEAVLQENQLPHDQAEHFYKLLDFSRKMTEDEDFLIDEEEEDESYTEPRNLLDTINQQVAYVQSLKDRNVSRHMLQLQSILKDGGSHPVVQSMILHLLMENEVAKEVKIAKFGKTMSLIPAELEDLSELPFTKKVLNVLDDILGQENPALYEAVKEVWIRHLYVLFPFLPEPTEARLWAAALHYAGYEMHGIAAPAEEVSYTYEVKEDRLMEAARKIYEIEEISYLQI